jgi:hypothetical protein
MSCCHRRIVCLVVLVLFVIPGISNESRAAAAQRGHAFEIEAHVGGVFASNMKTGTDTTSLLATPGPSFIAVNGTTSRRVPSFFFGDGALLLNQAAGLPAPGIPGALEATLGRPFFESREGAEIGFRITIPATSRFSAEVSFDQTRSPIAATSSARQTIIDTQRGSWQALLDAWKSEASGREGSVSFSSNYGAPRGKEYHLTGTVVFALTAGEGTVVPYLVGGGGFRAQNPDLPQSSISRRLFMRDTDGFSLTPDDVVLITPGLSGNSLVGVIGGGVKFHVAASWGLRLDMRAHLVNSATETLVTASTSSGILAPTCSGICIPPPIPENTYVLGGDPSIQFSIKQQASTASIREIAAFHGSFVQTHTLVSMGVFFRVR